VQRISVRKGSATAAGWSINSVKYIEAAIAGMVNAEW